MKTNLKATGMVLTPALEQYLSYKLSKVKKYINESSGETIAEVEIGKTTEHHRHGDLFKAEINLDIPGQGLKRAQAIEFDLYAAIDVAKADIIRQIKSNSSKQNTLFRKGARKMKNILRGWR